MRLLESLPEHFGAHCPALPLGRGLAGGWMSRRVSIFSDRVFSMAFSFWTSSSLTYIGSLSASICLRLSGDMLCSVAVSA